MAELELRYLDSFISPAEGKASQNTERFLQAFHNNEKMMLLSGPRSCGKTVLVMQYLLEMCCEHPNLVVYVARNEYAGIAESLLSTVESTILDLSDPHQPFTLYGGRHSPRHLEFKNGARMHFVGLEDGQKMRGKEPSIFFLNEAHRQKDPEAWLTVAGGTAIGRSMVLRQPDGMPWTQMIADCNPDAPTHWIYKYFNDDPTITSRVMLYFQTTDNPLYSDDGVILNSLGEAHYEEQLENYPPGVYRERDVFGRWVSAEGSVFPEFDFRKDVIDELPDLKGWDHYRGIDHGMGDPFVCLWASHNPATDMLIVHREYSKTMDTIDNHRDMIITNSYEETLRGETYRATWADHDPADNAMLRKAGIRTENAYKDIRYGLIEMNKRIGAGKLKIYKHLLIKADQNLIEKNLATNTLDEIGGYVYKKNKTGAASDDLPDPSCCDHRIDALRYICSGISRGTLKPADNTQIRGIYL